MWYGVCVWDGGFVCVGIMGVGVESGRGTG